MKYIVRAIKYFFYLMIILVLIIAILVAAHIVEADISKMFVHGYDSLWQIAIIMAIFAAIYPKIAFSTRTAHIQGSPEDYRDKLLQVMDLHGYRVEKEDGGVISFIKRSPFTRAVKMWEDRLVCSPTPEGLEISGITKDLVRVVSGLEAGQGDVNDL